MGNVKIGYGDSAADTATLLLAAAEKTEHEVWEVRHSDGAFYAPEDVAKEAGVDYEADSDEAPKPEASPHDPNTEAFEQGVDPVKPAKKAAAKKSGN